MFFQLSTKAVDKSVNESWGNALSPPAVRLFLTLLQTCAELQVIDFNGFKPYARFGAACRRVKGLDEKYISPPVRKPGLTGVLSRAWGYFFHSRQRGAGRRATATASIDPPGPAGWAPPGRSVFRHRLRSTVAIRRPWPLSTKAVDKSVGEAGSDALSAAATRLFPALPQFLAILQPVDYHGFLFLLHFLGRWTAWQRGR